MTKPLTASVAWMPINVPARRPVRRRLARIPTPTNAASASSAALIMPKESVSRPRLPKGPRSTSTRQLRPPMPRRPCKAASGQGGATLRSVRRCRAASAVPNSAAAPRMMKAAFSMTRAEWLTHSWHIMCSAGRSADTSGRVATSDVIGRGVGDFARVPPPPCRAPDTNETSRHAIAPVTLPMLAFSRLTRLMISQRGSKSISGAGGIHSTRATTPPGSDVSSSRRAATPRTCRSHIYLDSVPCRGSASGQTKHHPRPHGRAIHARYRSRQHRSREMSDQALRRVAHRDGLARLKTLHAVCFR